MRIYSVGNSARVGVYVAAPDPDVAVTVALAIKHARYRRNLRATDDTASFEHHASTDGHTGIDTILNGTTVGIVRGRGNSYTLDEIMQGIKKPPTHWSVHAVVP